MGLKSPDPLNSELTLAASQYSELTKIYVQNTSLYVCVCVCACVVLETGQGVGGRPEASLGKHKLQTGEIARV